MFLTRGGPGMVDREGLEPSTNALKGRCSTIELPIQKHPPCTRKGAAFYSVNHSHMNPNNRREFFSVPEPSPTLMGEGWMTRHTTKPKLSCGTETVSRMSINVMSNVRHFLFDLISLFYCQVPSCITQWVVVTLVKLNGKKLLWERFKCSKGVEVFVS